MTNPLVAATGSLPTRRHRSVHRVLVLAVLTTLLSGCTITISGHGRPAEAYVDPQGAYAMIVPFRWGPTRPVEALPAAESWLLPAVDDGVRPNVLAVTRLVTDGEDVGMIDVLYAAQQEILAGGAEEPRINSVRMVTGSAGDLLGLLDFSQILNGSQSRQLDVIAVDETGQGC